MNIIILLLASSLLTSHREAVMLNRLKIGHSCVTYMLLSTVWRRPTDVRIGWCYIYIEAYTSGLSRPTGHLAEVLHCSFFERHFWKHRQL